MSSDASHRWQSLGYESRLHDLEALVQVVNQINRSLDPENVLTASLTGVQSVLDADYGCFVLINPLTHTLELARSENLPASLRARLEAFACHFLPKTDFVQSMERILIVSQIGERLNQVLAEEGLANPMLIPLLTRNRLIGVLLFVISNTKLLAPIGVDLLMSIGDQVALAIENAWLHTSVSESEKWHRAFIEASPDAIWESAASGKTTFVNDAACRIFGYDRATLLTLSIQDLIVIDYERGKAVNTALLRDGYVSNVQTTIRTRTGDIRIVGYTLRTIQDPNGVFAGYQVIFRDITEQTLVWEQLEQRNKELAALNAIARILGNPLEIGKALDQVCEQIISITGLETVVIYLMDESAKFLNLLAHHGLSENLSTQARSLGLDDPTTRQILASGETFVLSDKTYPAEGFAGPRAEGYLAGICVPLRQRDKLVGAILVGSKTKREFGPSDVELMQNISAQIGVALDKADLFAQMQRRMQELDGLAELSAVCVKYLDIHSIAIAAVECANKLLDVDFVMLRLREQDQMRLAAYRSKHNLLLRETIQIDDAIEQVVTMPRPLAVTDINAYPMPEGLRQNFRNDRLGSLVIVPMIVDNQVVGTFAIANEEPGAWKTAQIDLANTIGNQIGVALQNAKNYGQAQQQLKELKVLAQLSATWVTNLDVQAIAQAAVASTSQLLPATLCSVRLLEGEEMRLVASYSAIHATLPPSRTLQNFMVPASTKHVPVIINDVDQAAFSDELRASFLQLDTRAALFVPLVLHELTIGILIVGYSQPHEWQAHEVELVQTIANQVASAVNQAQLFQNVLSEQRKVQAIFDSGLSGLFATDANGHIVMFNRAAERITGQTLKDIRGLTWQEIFSDPSQTPPTEPLINEALLRKKTVFAHDGRFIRTHDGRSIPVAKAVAPLLDDKDNVTGAVGAFWDLSREQAAEMERDEFLRLAAHQIRTPLTALLSALQLYARPNLADDRRAEMWALIMSQGERLRRFASQFLDFESTVNSERAFQSEPLPIASTVRALVKEFRADPGKHDFVTKSVKPEPMVYADLDRVEHVLRNLIDNAVNYSPSGSRITLSVNLVENNMVEVAVRDEGPGIPLAEQEKIFQPFYRAPDPNGRATYGHGLGLSIARGFVKEMGGDIWVEGAKGQGTTFHITLRRYR